MAALRLAGFMAWASVLGIAIPLAAQQVPPSVQPDAKTGQSAPGTSQPQPGAEPRTPPASGAPIVPRRIPIPSQPPGQAAPQGSPQPQSQAQPVPESASPSQAKPVAPQRRISGAPPFPSGGMISLNFNRADLVEIIHIIAQQLGLTYTIDPEVKGTVTINSAQPLRAEDLLPVFHQVLRMNGAVAVRTGNLYHIMPIKEGKGLARPVGQSKEDSFALQVIPVRFFSVAEMKRLLTPFVQPGGEIIDNPRGNFLIVMDLPSNIQRLMEIADLIDVQVFAGTRMEIYQPKVASAEELSQEMTKVMQSFASSAPQAENFAAEFIALPRINQLLVISHSEAAWTYAKRWLDRIDIVAEGPGRRIFIYPVENGKAIELADVLSQALGQPSTGTRSSTPTLQDLHRSTPGGTSGLTGAGRGTMGTSSFGAPGSFGQTSQPLGAYAAVPTPGQVAPPVAVSPQPAAPQPLPGVSRPAAPGAPAQQEQLRIVPDPSTNSLIIYGTVQEFQNIKNILKDLDAIPRQVLIEAMILQIDLKDSEDFGVDYEIFRKPRQTIFGKTFDSNAAIRNLGDLFGKAFGPSSGLSAVVGDNTVSALIRAAATDSRVKIISSPSVLASDNRPARIQVGSEEPIPTGTVQSPVSGGTITSSTTVQYRNTGRIMTIIPQVNSQGLVNLQVKAEVSARGEDVTVGQDSFPSFNTQDAETTAVVHDGETLVIGGLIGEQKSRGRSGIPYLMDIPVIGRFFSTTNDSSNRTELIMLITPRVVRNRTESREVTEDFKSKLNAVRNELERMERDRAKSQPKPPPANETPSTEPTPQGEKRAPQSEKPAPSAVTPRTGASLSPESGAVTGISTSTTEEDAADLPSLPEAPSPTIRPGALPVNYPIEKRSGEVPAVKRSPAQPPYLLSFSTDNTTPSTRRESKSSDRQKNSRHWTVQVASLADKKDAEPIVDGLRSNGYDAYIATFETEGKTWFRVRVGRVTELQTANQLRQALVDRASFKQAYVVAY
ncbi:MAG: type II secretion system secretin GspD [Chloroflexota bacterium]